MDGGDADISRVRSEMHQQLTLLTVANLVVVVVLVFLGSLIIPSFIGSTLQSACVAVTVVLVGAVPMGLALRWRGKVMGGRIDRLAKARERQAADDAQRRKFDAQVNDALDMADNEDEALQVVERAFARAAADQPVELLLADHSHAHLERKVVSSGDSSFAGCPVAAPFDCPAARRARAHIFNDAEAVNACPKLAGRLTAGTTAMCLPISVMGRAVGVIHTLGVSDPGREPALAAQLESIARQSGARLELLRVMAETQSQASTDGLTGLLNRRAFENGWRQTKESSPIAAVAMADLDHFKTLNDTYGHDTGDRALRVFAEILRSTLRGNDLISRRGGEEFAVYFPGCPAAAAVAGLQRVQQRLQQALIPAGLPSFTASFGVVEATPGDELDQLLIRADAALFAAKHAGRDRVIVHDAAGEEQLYPATAFPVDGATALV